MKDLKDLIKELEENKEKELKSFDQLVEHYQSFNDRNIVIGEIGYEIAVAVDSIIRFWNKVDEEAGWTTCNMSIEFPNNPSRISI